MISDDIQEELMGDPLIIINKEFKKPWRDYKDQLVIAAQWLYENKRLQNLPVKDASNGKQYLLNSEPKHDYGRKFDAYRKIADSVYLNTNYDRKNCERNAKYLMGKFAPGIEFEILGDKPDTHKTENEKEHNGLITKYKREEKPLFICDDPKKRENLEKKRLKNLEQERKAKRDISSR